MAQIGGNRTHRTFSGIPKVQKRVCDKKQNKIKKRQLVGHGTTTKQSKTKMDQVGGVGQRDGSAFKNTLAESPGWFPAATWRLNCNFSFRESEALFWSSKVPGTPKMNIHI